MKYFILMVVVLIGVLSGCNSNAGTKQGTGENGGNQTNVANQTDTAEVNQATNENQLVGEKQTDTPYNFNYFELDVEYAKDKSFEVDYATVANGIVAEIDDELNNIKIKGNDAINKLETSFKSLNFDAATKDDEVLKQVVSAFNLKEDYKSFELEVKFTDGTQKEYKFNK